MPSPTTPPHAPQGGAQASETAEATDDPLLTTAQAAQHVGKAYKQFTAWAHDYKVPRQGTGRQTRYRVSDLDAVVSRISTKGQQPLALAEKTDDSPAELSPMMAALMADRERQNDRIERLAIENGRLQNENERLTAELEQARQGAAPSTGQEKQEKPRGWLSRLFGR